MFSARRNILTNHELLKHIIGQLIPFEEPSVHHSLIAFALDLLAKEYHELRVTAVVSSIFSKCVGS
jgi:hypothetical protein